LSHEQIKSTVDHHLDDVRDCMRQNGEASGKLVVQFAIQPDGKVLDPKPKESSSNHKLDACIAHAFGKWTFPKPKGGALMGVVYPFTFSAPKPPPQGKLEQALIVKTVNEKEKQADLKACFDEAVKEKKDLNGTIKVAMVIATAGTVTEAKVQESSTGSAA